MTLYEMSNEYRNVLENLEIDPETGEIINLEELEQMQGQLYDKTEAVAIYIKELKAESEMIAAEEKALKERKESKIKKAENLTRYLGNMMTMNAMPSFETSKVKVSSRKSEAVVVAENAEIPEKYLVTKTEVKPDKTALKKAIKSGEEIPGVIVEERVNWSVK